MPLAEDTLRPIFSEMAGYLRVGVRNLDPMPEEQMELVHIFLVRAIATTTLHGEGPTYLGFFYKSG